MSEAVVEAGEANTIVNDFSRDKQVFGVPWGKAMMWIFLLSDTFIFSCFLVGYSYYVIRHDGDGREYGLSQGP
jgi:cytochrome c oxidase subunit 3